MNKKSHAKREQREKSTWRNTQKEEESEGKLKELRRKEQADQSVVPSLRKSAQS